MAPALLPCDPEPLSAQRAGTAAFPDDHADVQTLDRLMSANLDPDFKARLFLGSDYVEGSLELDDAVWQVAQAAAEYALATMFSDAANILEKEPTLFATPSEAADDQFDKAFKATAFLFKKDNRRWRWRVVALVVVVLLLLLRCCGLWIRLLRSPRPPAPPRPPTSPRLPARPTDRPTARPPDHPFPSPSHIPSYRRSRPPRSLPTRCLEGGGEDVGLSWTRLPRGPSLKGQVLAT